MAQTPAQQGEGKAGKEKGNCLLQLPSHQTPAQEPQAELDLPKFRFIPNVGRVLQCPMGGDELYRQLIPCAPSLCPGWSCGAPEAPCVFFTAPASSQVTATAFPSPTLLAWLPVLICGKPDQETETSSLFRSVHKQLHQLGAVKIRDQECFRWERTLGSSGSAVPKSRGTVKPQDDPSCPAGCEPGSEIPFQSMLGSVGGNTCLNISQDHNTTAGTLHGWVTASVPMPSVLHRTP